MNLISTIFSKLLVLVLHVSGQNSFPPPLKPEEESALFARMQKGDMQARDKLFEHNL